MNVNEQKRERDSWSEEALSAVESAHPSGMAVQQIVDAFAVRGTPVSEATFRKYVQLGLLPRSVRVAREGKRRGSQGLYPASVVRQIDAIRRLMAQGYTIEEIKKEFLFIRGDVEELNRHLNRIFSAVDGILDRRLGDDADNFVGTQLREARELGEELLRRLCGIEDRMSMRARMARAAV